MSMAARNLLEDQNEVINLVIIYGNKLKARKEIDATSVTHTHNMFVNFAINPKD